MKRLQIMIDEELDDQLRERARLEKTSKGALVRRFVRQGLRPVPPFGEDPLDKMIGTLSFEPAPVDAVVYPAE
jgi:ribbon-helix-helix CopG family protein